MSSLHPSSSSQCLEGPGEVFKHGGDKVSEGLLIRYQRFLASGFGETLCQRIFFSFHFVLVCFPFPLAFYLEGDSDHEEIRGALGQRRQKAKRQKKRKQDYVPQDSRKRQRGSVSVLLGGPLFWRPQERCGVSQPKLCL